MSKVLVVYHSCTGNTEEMAKSVYKGAVSAGAKATLKKAAEATAEDILDCDVVVFGTPNNFHYMAGIMKDFFDRVWMTVGDRAGSKLYASFGSAGSGQPQCLESIDIVCGTFSEWKRVSFKKALEGIMASGKPSAQVLEQCRELGTKLARL